ncbi:C6 zinc finger domain protein [Aspergillus heteromorphus CBS 117.55]|uniref:C6 zinc finger domain protein n=1 Tax=Aspergillus heteromorphus CBS 117.55 TaxID=1448321 RepID=A0A317WEX2_9EURO|nr:C6 zinc finger domain protein [Aspergillus heteromorphus CBS 117.55]PWY84984.1 C6 zinc finger domain protein [Aspergillus heteromorphus CBS 117.55]
MKRKATPLPNASKRPPRQDPVSCDSCRTKKIKCDRQQPCNSCLARRLPCSYERPGPRTGSPAPFQGPAAPLQHGSVDSSVDRRDRVPSQPAGQSRNRESVLTADWLENIHMADRVAAATPKWLRDEMTESGGGRTPDQAAPSAALLSRPYMNKSATSENPATVGLTSFLPTKTETLELFRYYHRYVEYQYHILIPQRVEEQINGIYRCVDTGSSVDLNHLALLFSILASSLYLQLSLESSVDAEACSREFSFLTGAALIQSHYPASPTLEGLQATLVVVHNLSNWNIPPSVSSLFTHGALVSQAKNLMLHCIDSPRLRDAGPQDETELEPRRRLWWDLVSYDWLVGFLTGPQEWTYQIHPDQMNVNQPSNVDDAALGTVSQPESTPTDMSFALQRLKLSLICREVVDATSHEHLHGLEVSYDKILSLDRKFHQGQASIPEFFRLDPTSRRRFASLYEARPTIAWQGCLLQQGYFSRLCRLHRDFFIRGAREPAYSYSHVICLQSARKVLEIKRIMDGSGPSHTPPNSVVWSVMHHVFMAAVILLLDICFNWDDILAEKRKEEVLDACRMMNKAQESSSLVKQGITAMMGVLQRHWKSGKHPDGHLSDSGVETGGVPGPDHPATIDLCEDAERFTAPDPYTVAGDRQLEDIFSELLDTGNELALESTDWTDLLNELTEPGFHG